MRYLDSGPLIRGLTGGYLLAAWVGFGLAYYVAARLGLQLAIEPGTASPFWPPAGVALAVVLRFGRRLAPAILPAEMLAAMVDGIPFGTAFGMGLGNTLAAFAAVQVLRRMGCAPPWLHRTRDVLGFVGAAALFASTVSASFGVASLFLGGVIGAGALPIHWFTWWLGDSVGVLVVGGLLLSLAYPVRPGEGGARDHALVLGAHLLLCAAVFGGLMPQVSDTYPLAFLVLPVLLWAAFRVSVRSVALLLLILALVATAGTVMGLGPFHRPAVNDSLLLLQTYLLIIGATALVVRAVLTEREQGEEALNRHREELEQRVRAATAALRGANEELEEERNFMSVVQDTIRTLLVVMDRTGRILVFNRACQQLTGWTEEDAVGRTPWDLLIPPDQEPGVRAVFDRLTAGMFPNEYENDWVTRDGRRVRTEWANTAILDEQGEVQYVVASGLDVTRRRAAEAALERTEQEWTSAIEAFDDGVYLADAEGRLRRANQSFYAMTGLTPPEVLGRPLLEVVCPPQAGGRNCDLTRIVTAGQEGVITLEPGDPGNPTDRPLEISHQLIRDLDGRVSGMIGALHDLSAVCHTEQQLQRLNAHIRLLLDSTVEGIYGVDLQGRCTFVNPAAARMLGYEPDDMHGQNVHRLIHHSHEDGTPYPDDQCPILGTLAGGQSITVDDEVLWHRDGEAVPVQYSSNPVVEDGRVIGAVVVFRNVAESREMARHLNYLASHDTLTGLLNRHSFDRHLRHALENARLDRDTHVLCYLDLDQFKIVNDTCGHVAGDELLRQLAVQLRQRVRRGDILARLGGDEFGVLLQACGPSEALPVIEGLRQAIQEYRFAWQGKTFALGVSIGVVQLTGDTESVAAALSAADSACYAAKDGGRNRIHVYQAGDAELARRHGEMQWVSRLHAALAEDRFVLAGQPIVPVGGPSAGLHLEVLVRLRDETGELVPPGAFIPAAERYNLMPAIDRWVVRHTFAWLRENAEILERLELCAVNLSGSSLGDPGLRDFIEDQARIHGIEPRHICFEITETAAVANLSSAATFIAALKAVDFRFALDDFGSGMSSFAYLKNLPVDFLKIDGNFVKDILVDPIDEAMVRAINQVGHEMGLRTIAEFVESEAILERLRSLGVDYAQGFGIALPRLLSELEMGRERDAATG